MVVWEYRLIPYTLRPPNLAPVGAMGLYGGARLPLWQALSVPLLVMFISDFILWKLTGWRPFDPFVYSSFIIYVLLGRTLRNSRSPGRFVLVSLLGSLQFFLITNFGVWYYELDQPGARYPSTLAGLVLCLLAGLPFFAGTLEGDLIFSAVLFWVHEKVEATVTVEEDVPAAAPAAEKVPAEADAMPRPEEVPA